MNQIKSSPWGQVDVESKLQEGVFFVSTPSHGGFMVHKSVKLSEAAKANSETFGEYFCFEEDCQAAIVAYELQISNGRTTLEDLKRSLCMWNPSYVQEIGQSEWFKEFPRQSN